MALKRITPPTTLAVLLVEAKSHLRVDFDDDDTLITTFIGAAISHAENFMGRALVDQTWELTIDSFPDNEVKLPIAPLIEVESVKYDDGDGNEQTLSDASYTVDAVSEPGWVVPVNETWPTPFDGINAVRIRFRAGYVDNGFSPAVGVVPADIKAALLLYIGTLYANRETIVVGQTVMQMPWASEQLLRPHRLHVALA